MKRISMASYSRVERGPGACDLDIELSLVELFRERVTLDSNLHQALCVCACVLGCGMINIIPCCYGFISLGMEAASDHFPHQRILSLL